MKGATRQPCGAMLAVPFNFLIFRAMKSCKSNGGFNQKMGENKIYLIAVNQGAGILIAGMNITDGDGSRWKM